MFWSAFGSAFGSALENTLDVLWNFFYCFHWECFGNPAQLFCPARLMFFKNIFSFACLFCPARYFRPAHLFGTLEYLYVSCMKLLVKSN